MGETSAKTVFIIGAGASADIGLPVGEQLKGHIADRFRFAVNPYGRDDTPTPVEWALHELSRKGGAGTINGYMSAAARLVERLPFATSIDNLLHSLAGDAELIECGKIGIASSILEAERASKLYIDSNSARSVTRGKRPGTLDPDGLKDSWYQVFGQRITEGATRDTIGARLSGLVFIIFNYDRCLEHFLFHHLRLFYGFSDSETKAVVSNATFLHPYGTIGSLPWEGGNNPVSFGEKAGPDTLIDSAKQIRTFTEGMDPNGSPAIYASAHIAKASQIVFLGFAFLQINMSLLDDGDLDYSRKPRVIGTALGISDEDKEIISSELKEILPGSEPNLFSGDCAACFHHFSRWLSFSSSSDYPQ